MGVLMDSPHKGRITERVTGHLSLWPRKEVTQNECVQCREGTQGSWNAIPGFRCEACAPWSGH